MPKTGDTTRPGGRTWNRPSRSARWTRRPSWCTCWRSGRESS